MRERIVGVAIPILALVSLVCLLPAAAEAWEPARTPDGQPDIQGFWTGETGGPEAVNIETALQTAAVKLHMGDARGAWEGNTLVVQTTNLNDWGWFDSKGTIRGPCGRIRGLQSSLGAGEKGPDSSYRPSQCGWVSDLGCLSIERRALHALRFVEPRSVALPEHPNGVPWRLTPRITDRTSGACVRGPMGRAA